MNKEKAIRPHERAAAYIRLPGIFILGAMLVIVGLALYNADTKPEPGSMEFLWVLSATLSALSAVFFAAASAVKRRRPWGRIAAILLSALLLAVFPFGTAIGAVVLYNLCSPWENWSDPATTP